MFSPVPGGFQFLASTSSEVMLASGMQLTYMCNCSALQLVHAEHLLCVHDWVEATGVGINGHCISLLQHDLMWTWHPLQVLIVHTHSLNV